MTASPGEGLIGIGDFSRYAGLSVRMLRHYAQHGLLDPAEVDPVTGYRRYAPSQLEIAGRIRQLRDAGCGIPLIAELLPLFGSPARLRSALDDHVAGLDAEARRIAAQRTLAIEIADLAARPAPYAVAERDLPALRVLQLRRTVADYPAEGGLWAELAEVLARRAGVDPEALGPTIGATYYDEEFREDDVEMAIWREYRGSLEPRDGFEIADLPPRRVAWTTHHGSFENIGDATAALGRWIGERSERRAGPLSNVYVVGPGRTPDPARWITEVNVPLR